MDDIKELMRRYFLEYASYVILERALPRVDDGLKPVFRRILYTLRGMHDGKFHKVANIVGQTMAYHPHGDAPIYEALVNLANKGYLLEQQGNFGNPHTGDPAAAARYIEARLSPLALETLFNPELTPLIPSYDGRHQEAVVLPAKIPLLLLQGAEGIAVGMATEILPHNFVEVLEAEIALIEGRAFQLAPDFLSGGLADVTLYDKGHGKVRVRAKLAITDPKTITISELAYSTTTESLIRSIDEAAKRGKIKLEAINDYTAEKVEVELKLPRGHYAEEIVEALYAYTECEVTLHPQMITIRDKLPCEMDVDAILRLHSEILQGYLKQELLFASEKLGEEIFEKTLERLFVEEKLYLLLEEQESDAAMHSALEEALKPFHSKLSREPLAADRERLLNIPVRRISRYDSSKTEGDIVKAEKERRRLARELADIPGYTTRYLNELLKKYGDKYPRRTQITTFGTVDKRAMERQPITVYYDKSSGFAGTKVQGGDPLVCTNFDKLLALYDDGSYSVMNIPEKQYLHGDGKKVLYFGVADKQTVFTVVYRNKVSAVAHAKRFVISQYILDKVYRYVDESDEVLYCSAVSNPVVDVYFVPKVKQKIGSQRYPLTEILIKGVTAKGLRLAARPVTRVIAVVVG